MVQNYKYLGVWFTSSLIWSSHIDIAVGKAKKETLGLRAIFNNNRLPARAKSLIWHARVRPRLEHGAEVWKANSKQADKIEFVQVQAGVKIFKLSSRSNQHAVRELLRAPRLALRRQAARTKYVAKLKAMAKDRLAREVVSLPPGKAVKGQHKHKHWLGQEKEVIFGDDLRSAYETMHCSADRNNGVLPRGADPTVHDFDYFPLRAYCNKVDRWVKQKNLQEFKVACGRKGSTLGLIARAIEKDETRVPHFTLTQDRNRG